MIEIKEGSNEIAISNNYSNVSGDSFTFVIKSDMSLIEKQIVLSVNTSSNRFIKFILTTTTNEDEEDLANGVVYLEEGRHSIAIYNEAGFKAYDNILDVEEFIVNELYEYDSEDSAFVFNG